MEDWKLSFITQLKERDKKVKPWIDILTKTESAEKKIIQYESRIKDMEKTMQTMSKNVSNEEVSHLTNELCRVQLKLMNKLETEVNLEELKNLQKQIHDKEHIFDNRDKQHKAKDNTIEDLKTKLEQSNQKIMELHDENIVLQLENCLMRTKTEVKADYFT